MESDTVKLGTLFKIKHGYAFKGEYFSSEGPYVLLTPGNFYDEGGFKMKGEREKYYVGEFPNQYVLSKGDLIIAMTEQVRGLLGSSAIVPASNKYLHNQRLGLIVELDESKIEKKYLYYLFNTKVVRDQIQSSATGLKVRHTSPSNIYSVKISLPPLTVQEQIAYILSAYDDLIENNYQRIRILREMGQILFREWFVNFHFPGYEVAKFVESTLGKIPEGWKVQKLEQTLGSLESGKRPKGGVGDLETGVPSVGAENISGLGKYDYLKDKFVSREFYDSMNKGKIGHKDVLLYKDGANIGRKSMFRNGFPHDECCINEHVFILRMKDYGYQNYLFFWLDQDWMTQKIANLNTNAAQPGINQKSVFSLPILMPEKNKVNEFDKIIENILDQLFTLAKKQVVLSKSRDLLLPKLMSGEVGVLKK